VGFVSALCLVLSSMPLLCGMLVYSELTSSVSMVKPGGRGPSHDSIWKSWRASSGMVTVLQMVGGNSMQTHMPGGSSTGGVHVPWLPGLCILGWW